MTDKVTRMHESGHFMIKVLTGVCGFMATIMTAALLWGASTLNAMQIAVGVLQEQIKASTQQVEFMRAELRDSSKMAYTSDQAAADKKMIDLQMQILSNRISVLEGRKQEIIRGNK